MRDRRHAGLNLPHPEAADHEEAETVVFGFWVFLMADLVLFALLFATYASMSVHGVADGPAPHDLFELRRPLIETVVLLASSFTAGMAILDLKYARTLRGVSLWLAATAALGVAFLALEGLDFVAFATEKGAPPQASGFLSVYWALTGTHWLHVFAALVWMAALAVQLALFGAAQPVKLRLMRLALYWHMLDVVWVGIFTFVFLYGAAP